MAPLAVGVDPKVPTFNLGGGVSAPATIEIEIKKARKKRIDPPSSKVSPVFTAPEGTGQLARKVRELRLALRTVRRVSKTNYAAKVVG